MIEVDVFEAKAHLSSLLDRECLGEQGDRSRVSAAVDGLLTLRQEATLDGVGWKALRDEGRR